VVSFTLYAQGKRPWCQLDRNWKDPRANLDAVEKIKISYPGQELNPNSSAIQPIAYCYSELSCPGSEFVWNIL
jgi:hypothetical protein